MTRAATRVWRHGKTIRNQESGASVQVNAITDGDNCPNNPPSFCDRLVRIDFSLPGSGHFYSPSMTTDEARKVAAELIAAADFADLTPEQAAAMKGGAK